jgi:hypothetical protein
MLLGIYVASKLFAKKLSPEENIYTWKYSTALFAYTAFGIAFRAGIMAIVNYVTLRFDPPVGFGLAEPAILGYYLPVTTIFNASLALYTIPLGYLIAVVIKRNIKHL